MDRGLPLLVSLALGTAPAIAGAADSSTPGRSSTRPRPSRRWWGGSGRKDEIRIRTGTTADGRVEIRISDNGPGIPESVRDRIYDPFFTTKEVGKGTGQGLAIAHSVVREHHQGELIVESEVGR